MRLYFGRLHADSIPVTGNGGVTDVSPCNFVRAKRRPPHTLRYFGKSRGDGLRYYWCSRGGVERHRRHKVQEVFIAERRRPREVQRSRILRMCQQICKGLCNIKHLIKEL